MTIPEKIGPYVILAPLGSGSTGDVFRARQEPLQRDVALKLLRPDAGDQQAQVYRFGREIRILSGLDFVNVVRIYDAGTLQGHNFIAMELVDGESLQQRLKRGPLEINQTVDLAIGIAQGLAYLHNRDVLHRDITAGNVLLTRSGIPKLTDFGLARERNSTLYTQPGMLLGTLGYMAPELFRGESTTVASDLWSLGCVLHLLVTGKLPIDATGISNWVRGAGAPKIAPVSSRVKTCPEPLSRIIAGLLDLDPNRRPTGVGRIVEELKALQARPKPTSGRSPLPPARVGGRASPAPRRWGWALAAAGLMGTGTLLALRPAERPPIPVSVAPRISPSPRPRVNAQQYVAFQKELAAILQRWDKREPQMDRLMYDLSPTSRNYEEARRLTKLLQQMDREDHRDIADLQRRVQQAAGDLETMPPAGAVLYARVAVHRMRSWCWVQNSDGMETVLKAIPPGEVTFDQSLKIIDDLYADPYLPSCVPLYMESVERLIVALRCLSRDPVSLANQMADTLRGAHSVGYFYVFRKWPGDARARVDVARNKLLGACDALPGEAGAVVGRLARAAFAMAAAELGAKKVVQGELKAALAGLLTLKGKVPYVEEIHKSLASTFLPKPAKSSQPDPR